MIPVVPPLSDHRLEAFLDSLRSAVLKNNSAAEEVTDTDDPFGVGSSSLDIHYETPVVLAGVGETEDTEDAWTTVASGAEGGASYAVIQFYMVALDGNADGFIEWRTSSSAPTIRACEINPGTGDAEANTHLNWYFVPLDNGNFQYYADTTAGSLDWEVRRIGYVL